MSDNNFLGLLNFRSRMAPAPPLGDARPAMSALESKKTLTVSRSTSLLSIARSLPAEFLKQVLRGFGKRINFSLRKIPAVVGAHHEGHGHPEREEQDH